ncbi:hypothetical protein RQP46_001242 [Phenoliferia psychrophenolica]
MAGGSSQHDELPPPSYSPSVQASASGSAHPPPPPSSSGATEPLFEHPFDGTSRSSDPPSFAPEALADLNPEVSKKLAREARESGHDVADFGFEAAPGGSLRAGELPPNFRDAEVRPTYSIDSAGDIVSHDATLNSSPVALLRFLRLHSSSPPTLSVHIRGTHTEKRSETNVEMHNGHRRVKTTTRDVEVEDFQFFIDAAQCVEDGLGKALRGGGGLKGVMYEVGGWEAAHRGGAWRTRERKEGEVDPETCACACGTGVHRRPRRERGIRLPIDPEEEEGKAEPSRYVKPGVREIRRLDKARRERDSRGFPGFVSPDSLVDMDEDHRPQLERDAHPSLLYHSHFVDLVETHSSLPFALSGISATHDVLVRERDARDEQIRAVVDAYTRSKKMLKELRVTKEVYGWNFRLLEAGLRATIDRTRYSGTVQIEFRTTPTTLIIRPENNISKIFSLPIWAKFFLWIVLVYPILLLIELFNGDRYDNLRVAFPLTRWRRLPLPSTSSSRPLTNAEALELARPLAARSPKIAQLPDEHGTMVYLIGVQDGEFLKMWEDGIVDAVRMGRRGVALKELERGAGAGSEFHHLRGYHPDQGH